MIEGVMVGGVGGDIPESWLRVLEVVPRPGRSIGLQRRKRSLRKGRERWERRGRHS